MTPKQFNPCYVTCPYRDVPATSLWASAIASLPLDQLNPQLPSPLRMSQRTRIGTAGSCFSQHISRALVRKGLSFQIVEPAPEWFTPEDRANYNYEVFSARYGNIYTALQLVQLFERAYGRFQPEDFCWRSPDGRWFDLLRPRIQPNGFASRQELVVDQQCHLAAVRRLFETVEVFIFTLGLTEAWLSRKDGTVYPTCPGCGVGEFSPERYCFHNFTVAEVTAHLDAFLNGLRAINPGAHVILTVSPVPLAATMEPRHVLQSTIYSKSVLRVAAEETILRWSNTSYFCSFEIITATFRSHEFFTADRRSVAPSAVDLAISLFLKQFSSSDETAAEPAPKIEHATPGSSDGSEVICDEAIVFAALADHRAA